MRVCRKCGTAKPLDLFGRSRTGEMGRTNLCKDCRNARERELRMLNGGTSERQKACHRRWRAENPEKGAEHQRTYKARHPDRVAESQNRYMRSEKGKAAAARTQAKQKAEKKTSAG